MQLQSLNQKSVKNTIKHSMRDVAISPNKLKDLYNRINQCLALIYKYRATLSDNIEKVISPLDGFDKEFLQKLYQNLLKNVKNQVKTTPSIKTKVFHSLSKKRAIKAGKTCIIVGSLATCITLIFFSLGLVSLVFSSIFSITASFWGEDIFKPLKN